jgi:tetratricopeptide (TPR) repeat protein
MIAVRWVGSLLVIISALVPLEQTEIGRIDFPASGRPEAQAHFRRGLLWFYNFGYDDAIEEFREAQRLDPDFAMAYWGEALSHNRPLWFAQDLDAARAALGRLGPSPEARAARARTPRERAYLQAVEALYGEGGKEARDRAYAAAMRDLSTKYPDDLEAACLHAFALLATVPLGQHGAPAAMKAGEIAEDVFRKNPRHPGAAHAIIHAFDDREHAARALPAARAYAQIAPQSSHARHMPSHIFLQLGLWDEAAGADAASWEVSVERVRTKGLSIADRDYHSLSWLVYELLQQGKFEAARDAMKPFEDALTTNEPRRRDELATLRAYYTVESEDWHRTASRTAFDNADELFALGMGAAMRGDTATARAVLDTMQRLSRTDPDEGRRILEVIMERQLAALVEMAGGRDEAALTAAAEAARQEDLLPRPVGRTRPVKPSHELLGELFMRAGRPAEAAAQFERSLWRAANRSRSVLGLARAAKQHKDLEAARRHYTQFLKNWHAADPGRSESSEARAFIGFQVLGFQVPGSGSRFQEAVQSSPGTYEPDMERGTRAPGTRRQAVHSQRPAELHLVNPDLACVEVHVQPAGRNG